MNNLNLIFNHIFHNLQQEDHIMMINIRIWKINWGEFERINFFLIIL
jgi:hypothetical protein